MKKNIKKILAFGDSLTNGFGVKEEFSYPTQLQNLLGIEVLNAGVDGEFSDEGLYRLKLLILKDIDLVILCHGANDILNKIPKAEIKRNIFSMIQTIQEKESEVLLVGVPNYYDRALETDRIYEQITNESKIMFENKVLSKITKESSLRNDFVHPNEKGYALMAEAFYKKLNEYKGNKS